MSRHDKKLAQIMGIFLYIGLNMCIVRSIESSHGDGFFEYSKLAIFVAIEEKLALKLIFFREHWFRHVLWWLLGIVSLRRFL